MPQFQTPYCAYHNSQKLTNFCSCRQCLLPVCPTCIKLHTQQHSIKNTQPQFQKLTDVFNQVYLSDENMLKSLLRLKQQLIQVQKVKKQNQSLILQKIKLYRNKLIREFERSLMQIQFEMVKKFQQQDQKFIFEIQQIDENIYKIQNDIQSQLIQLQSENGLRGVIYNLSRNYQIQCLKLISGLSFRIKNMLSKNIYLQVQQHYIQEMKSNIKNYIKLGIIQWTNKQTNNLNIINNNNNNNNNNNISNNNNYNNSNNKNNSLTSNSNIYQTNNQNQFMSKKSSTPTIKNLQQNYINSQNIYQNTQQRKRVNNHY